MFLEQFSALMPWKSRRVKVGFKIAACFFLACLTMLSVSAQTIIDGYNCSGGVPGGTPPAVPPTTWDGIALASQPFVDATGEPTINASSDLHYVWARVQGDQFLVAMQRVGSGSAGYRIYLNTDCDQTTGDTANGGAEWAAYFKIGGGGAPTVSDATLWQWNGAGYTDTGTAFTAAVGDSACDTTTPDGTFMELAIDLADFFDVCGGAGGVCNGVNFFSGASVAGGSFGSANKDIAEPDFDIYVNTPPTAEAGGDLTDCVNSPVAFDGSGSIDPDDDIVLYEWDFDWDGDPASFTVDATGGTPTHTYTLSGTYTVGLRVTDSWGCISYDSLTVTIENCPDIRLQKIVSNSTPFEGSQITYTITATNLGPGNATGVQVTDLLPTGVTYVSHSASQGTYSFGTGLWTIGNLNASSAVNLAITVGVNPGSAALAPITNTASLSAINETEGNPNNNSASVAISPVPIVDLSVSKGDSPDPVVAGNNLTYTIIVSNNGPSAATNVVAADTLPAGVTLVSTSGCVEDPSGVPGCSLGTIAALSSKQYTITVTVNSSVANGTLLTNTVTVSSSVAESNAGNNTASATTDVLAQADLSVTKSGADTVIAGNNLVYTVVVENLGPSDAQGVSVNDTLPAGVTLVSTTGCAEDPGGVPSCGLGSIAAGTSKQYTITVTVGSDTTGTLTNTATATSSTSDPVPGNNTATKQTTVGAEADLSISKSDSPDPVVAGNNLTYTLTVQNTGPSDAQNVVVTDTLPAGATLVSTTGCSEDPNGVPTCTLGTIPAGGSAGYTIVVAVDPATSGEITNSASVASSTTDNNTGNNSTTETTTVNGEADLSITKSDSPDPVIAGNTLTYTVTVNNAGPSNAQNAVVTDTLPAGVTLVSTTGCAEDPNGAPQCSLGTISAGGSKQYSITVTVAASVADGTTLTNSASVTSTTTDSNTADNSTSEDTTVSAVADLSVTKSDTPDPVTAGASLTYIVTVQNNGPSDAQNVSVNDTLPSGVTFVSTTGCATDPNGVPTCSLGTIAAGGSKQYSIVVTVDASTLGTITNSVAVGSDTTDPDTGNNSTSEDTQVQASADVEITKSVDNPTPNEGDAVVFTVTVTNNGPSAATGMEITDLLPGGVTYVSHSATQGIYSSGTGVWNVGNLAVSGSATLTLTATVDMGTGGTTITNTAAITSAGQPDPQLENNSASAAIGPTAADLSVQKTVDNATPNVGDAVTYTIVVSNAGPSDATGVQVTDLLPAGVTHSSNSPSQGTYTPATGVWAVGSVAAPGSATLTITATVGAGTGGQTVNNIAQITAADQSDPDSSGNIDNAVITVQQADLSLAKTVDVPSPNAGATVTFTLTLTNAGPDTASNVAVTDAVPSGLTLVNAIPSLGSYVGNVWTVSSLPVGSATLQLVATVDAGTGGQTITNTAEVTASDQEDPDSTPGNDIPAEDDQDSASVTVQLADLMVTKSVDIPNPGEDAIATYTVTVKNQGPNTATNVVLTDNIPGEVDFSSENASQGSYNPATGLWTVGSLASGATATLTIYVLVTKGTAGQTITNTAQVTSADQEDPDTTNNLASVGITPVGADLSVSKIVDNSSPGEGTTVTFTVTVENLGLAKATGTRIADVLPAGLTFSSASATQGTFDSGTGVWELGDLENTKTATLTLKATVDLGQAGNTITNTASVSEAGQTDPVENNNSASAELTPAGADLQVTKVADNTTPNEGSTVTYTVVLTNLGSGGATGVVLNDVLPAGIVFQSASVSFTDGRVAPSYDSGSGNLNVGDLPAGVSGTLTIKATVDPGQAGNTISNLASITAVDQTDPDPSNNTASVDIVPEGADLSVSKTVDQPEPAEGEKVTFAVTVKNNGPANATGVAVADLLPAGLTFVSETASQGAYNDATGDWTVGNLAAGVTASLSIECSVDSGTAGSQITNTASVTALDQTDPDASNNSASAVVGPSSADISIAKSVNSPAPPAGSQVEFTITVTNLGPSDSSGVVISDPLPAGLSFVTATASAGSYDSASGDWTIGDLASGASATLTLAATVGADQAGQTITNIASLKASSPPDPDAANDSASAAVIAGSQVVQTIPTLSEWGLILLALLLALFGVASLRRREV